MKIWNLRRGWDSGIQLVFLDIYLSVSLPILLFEPDYAYAFFELGYDYGYWLMVNGVS